MDVHLGCTGDKMGDSVCKSGPVQSFGPKMQDRDWNWFTFVLESKKTGPVMSTEVIQGRSSLIFALAKLQHSKRALGQQTANRYWLAEPSEKSHKLADARHEALRSFFINLVPILRVPRHLRISHAAVTRLPYLIGIIGWSSRRSSCHATHTAQKMLLFCSSGSRKFATLGKSHIVGMSLFFWFHLSIFGIAFVSFFSIHFLCLKSFVNYCNKTENLSPKFTFQDKSELSKGRLLA